MASQFQTWDNPMAPTASNSSNSAAPDPAAMGRMFEQMGFVAVAKHRSRTCCSTSRATSTSS